MSLYCQNCGQGVDWDEKECPCCNIVFEAKNAPLEAPNASIIDLAGRIGRQTYIVVSLVFFLLGTLFWFVVSAGEASGGTLIVLIILFVLPMLWVGFATTAKRCHDLNRPAWWAIASYIPLLNLILGVYLIFAKGTDGINQYGPPPNGKGKKPTPTSSENAQANSLFIINKEPSAANLSATKEDVVSDDKIYEKIGIEMETGNVDKAVWTRSFAISEGDDNKTRVTYINLRFKKLKEIE